MAYAMLAVGLILLAAFSTYAGLPLALFAPFFGLFLLLSVGLTRARAQLGPPLDDTYFVGPEQLMTLVAGPQRFSARTLGAFTLFYWFNRDYSIDPMPHQMEGLKLAERTGGSGRGMLLGLLAVAPVCSVALFVCLLAVGYKLGAGSTRLQSTWFVAIGDEQFNNLSSWLTGASRPNPAAAGFMGASFVGSVMLLMVRDRFPWFPLHPVGYAMASTWSMQYLWLCFVIGWLAKLAVVHYYGARGYRLLVPLAYGLILGDCVVGAVWALIGGAMGRPIFQPSSWF